MSNAPRSTRSFQKIDLNDLNHLADIARAKLETVFKRRPRLHRLYENRLIALCLCQGAAEHYVHPRSKLSRGVNDFDVWAFFALTRRTPFWNRRSSPADFGPSKFRRSSRDLSRYVGRRIDIFWRAIPTTPDPNPLEAIRCWLSTGRRASARHLSKKSVVVIWPKKQAGKILWPQTERPVRMPRGT